MQTWTILRIENGTETIVYEGLDSRSAIETLNVLHSTWSGTAPTHYIAQAE